MATYTACHDTNKEQLAGTKVTNNLLNQIAITHHTSQQYGDNVPS